MSQILEILSSLGINGTFYYQFVVFFVAFLGMKFIVFGPYLKAYGERVQRTEGDQQQATDLLDEAVKKEELFAAKAKELNGAIRDIFSEQNQKAKKEVEQILAVANKEAEQETAQARKELDEAVAFARKDLDKHIPSISEGIEKKFVES